MRGNRFYKIFCPVSGHRRAVIRNQLRTGPGEKNLRYGRKAARVKRSLFRAWALAAAFGIAALSAAFGIAALSGCYNVGFKAPAGVEKVFVPLVENQTFPFERGLEYDLTGALREKIEEQTDCVLVNSAAKADAVLEGVLKSYSQNVMAEDRYDRPSRLAARVEMNVAFRRSGGDEEIFFSGPVYERVSFRTSSELDSAKEEIVRRVAERILAVISWN